MSFKENIKNYIVIGWNCDKNWNSWFLLSTSSSSPMGGGLENKLFLVRVVCFVMIKKDTCNLFSFKQEIMKY